MTNQPCIKEIKEPKDCPYPVKMCLVSCDTEFSMFGEVIRYNTAQCRRRYTMQQRLVQSGLNAFERITSEKAVIDQANKFIDAWDQKSVSIIIPDNRQRRDFSNYLTMQLCSAGLEVLRVRESEMILALRNVKGKGIDENGECKELNLIWRWKTAKVLVIQGAALSGPIFYYWEAIKVDILKNRANLNLPTVFVG